MAVFVFFNPDRLGWRALAARKKRDHAALADQDGKRNPRELRNTRKNFMTLAGNYLWLHCAAAAKESMRTVIRSIICWIITTPMSLSA
jgi:hypothetical protein